MDGLQANRLLQLLPGLSISGAVTGSRPRKRFGYPANGVESFHVVLLKRLDLQGCRWQRCRWQRRQRPFFFHHSGRARRRVFFSGGAEVGRRGSAKAISSRTCASRNSVSLSAKDCCKA